MSRTDPSAAVLPSATITLPPLAIAAALSFWGWETGNLALALVIAFAIETVPRLGTRFDLQPRAYERLADLCTVFFVGSIIVSAAASDTLRLSGAILKGFQNLPVFIAPILLAQLASSAGRIRLSALLRATRQQKRENPDTRDPWVDLRPPYFVMLLIAAGIANQRTPVYAIGVVALVVLALTRARPAHVRHTVWAALIAAAIALSAGAQFGIERARDAVEAWVSEWYLRGINADPYRSATAIGTIGRLKEFDTIVARVTVAPEALPRVSRLHRATYNDFAGTSWLARGAPMQPLEPDDSGTLWTLGEGPTDTTARIALRLDSGKALLPLPGGVRQITDMPAITVRHNAFGAVRADLGGDWAQFGVRVGAGIPGAGPATAQDLQIPRAEQAAFGALAGQLQLAGLESTEIVRRVSAHFDGYRYSLYRDANSDAGRPPDTSPLSDFVQRTKSGHCEYFASATVLLLRAAGIPARYATGFVAQEYSTLEGAYLVRARHAHSWVRAWVGERWIEVDTTPAAWFEVEAKEAPFWQPVADLARWLGFRWSQRGGFEAGTWTYVLLAVLIVILAWRLARGRTVTRRGASKGQARSLNIPGRDSDLYALERALVARHGARPPSEPLTRWLRGLGTYAAQESRALLDEALALHQRYRFDPEGISGAERQRLREVCRRLDAGPDVA